MGLHYGAIVLATVLQFIVGGVWYSLIFGKLWGKIHGFDKLPKHVQQKMMKHMGPFYALQFIVTLISTVVLDIFIVNLSDNWNIYVLAGLLWLGFVVPAQVSSVIFGGTEGKWISKKIAVQAGASLIYLVLAAVILRAF